MDKFNARSRFLFSQWLPLFALVISSAIVLVPATRVYVRWKSAIGTGNNLVLSFGQFQWVIPRERLLRSAIESTARLEQGKVVLLNAPGHLLGAIGSELVVHHANGFPDPIGPFLWKVLSIPLFAIPAWFFAGRGIDGLLMRRRMRLIDVVLSATLVLLSVALSAGLQFGLSGSEREGNDLLVYYIWGFAWWSLLFAFPLAAWIRQRLQKVRVK